jgi:hypothetical protein
VTTGDFTTVVSWVRGRRRLHRTSDRPFDIRRLRKSTIISCCERGERRKRTGSSILDVLVRHVRCSSFDNSTTSSIHWRQWRSYCTSFRQGLPGNIEVSVYRTRNCKLVG